MDPGNIQHKTRWQTENKKLKELYNHKKSEKIRSDIANTLENKRRTLWRGVKQALNWNTGGGPGELRDEKGKILTKPIEISNRYHDNMEENIYNIAT